VRPLKETGAANERTDSRCPRRPTCQPAVFSAHRALSPSSRMRQAPRERMECWSALQAARDLGTPTNGSLRRQRPPEPRYTSLSGIAGAALACGIGVALRRSFSLHFDFRSALIRLGLLMGWSFIGSGFVPPARFRRRTGRASLPFGLLASPRLVAVFVHAVLAFPSGRARGKRLASWVGLRHARFVPLQLPEALVNAAGPR
jgi:hypothetical protein